MNLHMRLLLLILFSTVTISCTFREFTPQGYLFSYGVSEYSYYVYGPPPNMYYLKTLAAPDDDAQAVFDMFQAQGYSSNLRLNGGGGEYNGIPVDPATKEQLILDIEFAAENAGDRDTIVFYFAGHGGHIPSADGEEVKEPIWSADSAKENDWFFLYSDSTVDFPDLEVHFLSDDTLGTILETIPRGKIIVIFDSCNSGGFIGDTNYEDPWDDPYYDPDDGYVNDPRLTSFNPPSIGDLISSWSHSLTDYDVKADVALVLAAAGEMEDSLELSHGIFTSYLLQTPENGDINGDGYVSLFEIYEYTSIGVTSRNYLVDGQLYCYKPRITSSAVDYLLF